METIAEAGEFGLIGIIKGLLPPADASVLIGVGDDTAAFRPTPGAVTLATCDIQVEGRHFLRERTTPYQLGRRAAAINLSDIGAMGGSPRHVLVSLALPKDTRIDWVRELYRGLVEEMGRFGAAIVGGNLSAAPLAVIDITLLGEAPEAHLVRRNGARPGDAILVTGALGASKAGLRALEVGLDTRRADAARVIAAHLTPSPRVREGVLIGASGKATAMIDVSDGLAGDLGHICEASGVGAVLCADRIPVLAETQAIARELGEVPLTWALHGGEDFELCFCCRPQDASALRALVEERTATRVTQIGIVREGSGISLQGPDGVVVPVAAAGWDHFTGPASSVGPL